MIKKQTVFLFLLFCLFVFSGCTIQPEKTSQIPAETEKKNQTVTIAEKETSKLTDTDSLYQEYDSTDIVCFYVTVLGGNAADGTNHTLEEVNSYLNLQGMQNVEKILTEVILQVGNEDGPLEGEIGYAANASNATMNVRGRTSTDYPQKSYRLTLFKNAGFWRGQRAIALNKHPADVTRIRNMLYFDLLQDVPSIPSLRTQFVHLYVRDLTAENPQDSFEDYGLFTQVELPNNRYLRNHGLSIDGNLYKAQMCERFRYPEKLKLVTDPTYDAVAFSTVLEPKTGNDHSKLLAMLDAVNDYSLPAEELLQTYFDVDNLTSYLAFNILMGNQDSNAQNYLLYSPVNSQRWYYFCWDGDDCLNYSENEILGKDWQVGSWANGVSDYWGVVLFNRLLKLPEFRDALKEKVELLHTRITPERVADCIARYRKTADLYTTVLPDSEGMRATVEQREAIYAAMPGDVEKAYNYFLESMEKPMPFYLWDVEISDSKLAFNWSSSYDFQGEFLRYTIQLCKDWSFENVLWESTDLLSTTAETDLPEPGEYYWRVIVRDESGKEQSAFDQVITSSGAHTGMRRFIFQDDGSVVNPE